ncbi:LVIVD repeat-containing protein [Egicoccus sp. AB-alg2]|uniref:LVIVD repeat-containing protein n=1 Tax=Egicoccus sp. AB-alg2 TaxID=3242693 RepID=UPI00359E5615
MTRRRRWANAVLVPALVLTLGATPAQDGLPMPPGDAHGVDYWGTVELSGLTSMNVVQYGNRDVLFAVGRFGLRSYDISNPKAPQELGRLESDALKLPGDVAGTFWQSESTNFDQKRKLAFLSRDPRAFNQPQNQGIAGVYIIDIRDPAAPALITFHEVPAGHTTTCINDCQYLWSGGPAPRVDQPADWIGRPIFVTDVRNPKKPFTHPDPIDTGRWRGRTDYSHDVQVDNEGIAWVSGRGGVRGYRTEGRHWDPVQERYRVATAWDPIPYGGGEMEAPYTMLGAIHNSERPVDGPPGQRNGVGVRDSERPFRPGANDGADLSLGYEAGELIYVTDEAFLPCADAGKFWIASIKGSTDGQAWRSTDENPYQLETVGVWSPYQKEGSTDAGTCSAHYFKMKDGIVAGAWYSQGFRFLDVTDPTDPIQVAYFRPDGGSGFVPVWHGDVIYAGDSSLGIHVLTLDADAATASAARAEVLAPKMNARQAALAREWAASMRPDPAYGWSCPIPAA